jgi:hypothetical protein
MQPPQKDYMGFDDDSDEDSFKAMQLACPASQTQSTYKLQNEHRNKKKSCQLLLNLETRKEQQVLRCVTWEETDLQGRSCCGAAYEETDQTQTRFSNIGRLHHIFRSLKHL